MTKLDRITDAALSALVAAVSETAEMGDQTAFRERWARLTEVAPRTTQAIGTLIRVEGENVINILRGR